MKFSEISVEGTDFETSLFLLNLPLQSENEKKKEGARNPFSKVSAIQEISRQK